MKPNALLRALALLGALLFLTGPAWADDPAPLDPIENDVVLAWNEVAHDAAMTHDEYANGLAVVRIYAMVHLAQHDALSAIVPAFEPYVLGDSEPAADPVAAAAAAAHDVLAASFPDQRATFAAHLARFLAAVPDGEAETRGVALGRRAAAAVLALREDDGSDAPFAGDYVPVSGPGRYQFTPPYEFAALPGWLEVKPFALTSADQFRTEPPPALSGEAYAEAYTEVKAIGGKHSAVRTAEQLGIARFWEEFSDMGWNRIARVVAAERGLGLQSTARLFALLNVAMSDAYVAGWDSKYHHDFWRPVTAIRAAAEDGNPATEPDPAWESAIETPPVQDHPSTHSALGNAAATVLAAVFGDATPFTFSSTTADETMPSRRFESFRQAADENAESRVLGGIHFRFACEAGQQLGDRVAEWALTNYLQPLRTAQASAPTR